MIKKSIDKRKSQIAVTNSKIEKKNVKEPKSKEANEFNKHQKGEIMEKIKNKLTQYKIQNQKLLNKFNENNNTMNIKKVQLEENKLIRKSSRTLFDKKHSKNLQSKELKKSLSKSKSKSQMKLSCQLDKKARRKSLGQFQIINWNQNNLPISEPQKQQKKIQSVKTQPQNNLYPYLKAHRMIKNVKKTLSKSKQKTQNNCQSKKNLQQVSEIKKFNELKGKLHKNSQHQFDKPREKKDLLKIFKDRQSVLRKQQKQNQSSKFQSQQVSFQEFSIKKVQHSNLVNDYCHSKKEKDNFQTNHNSQNIVGNECQSMEPKNNLQIIFNSDQDIKYKNQYSNSQKISLITIKDFNSSDKKGTIEVYSKIENRESKLLNLLQQILNDKNLEQSIKERIKRQIGVSKEQISQKNSEQQCVNLGNEAKEVSVVNSNSKENNEQRSTKKQLYIQKKISAQINSQRLYNSPRHILRTPTNSQKLSSKQIKESKSFSSNKKIYPEYNFNYSQLNKGIQMQSNLFSPKDHKKQNKIIEELSELSQIKQIELLPKLIEPFDTSFAFIDLFCFTVFQYFASNQRASHFIQTIKKFKNYLMILVLKQNEFQEIHINDEVQFIPRFFFYQQYKHPKIFDNQAFKQSVYDHELKDLIQEHNLDFKSNQIHQCFANLIFDSLSQALYLKFQSQLFLRSILQKTKQEKGSLESIQYEQFKNIAAEAMECLLNWSNAGYGKLAKEQANQATKLALQIFNNSNICKELVDFGAKQFSKPWTHQIQIMLAIGQLIFNEQSQILAHLLYVKIDNL